MHEHATLVAGRAERHASPFGAGMEARTAGLLHDAGKASDLFTRRLEGKVSGLDHWTPGASLALHRYRERGIAVALAIQGHHLGLAQNDKQALIALHKMESASNGTLTVDCPDELLARLAGEGIELPVEFESLYDQTTPAAAALLDVRMLFSALVDADFLETEAHFARDERGNRQYRRESPQLDPGRALSSLKEEVARLGGESLRTSSAEVRRLRVDLFQACWDSAELDPGIFTLSAPTGSGKTLAMLAFALRHALRFELRRIIIAVPYLSILEQTARVYRDLLEPVFGRGYVLEHHSLAGTRAERSTDDEQGSSGAEVLRRRQAENWDAPVVLTTSVQLLESLFANRPGPCRKLHRLVDSVLLFDEVQTLPRWLTVATLATLSRLSERFGTTVVFSTATQPSFDALHERVLPFCAAGWRSREIVPPHRRLFRGLDRVSVEWRVGTWSQGDRTSWERLAGELEDACQALCIVNLRRHARALAELLEGRGVEGLFHLSTTMCPAHRQSTLATVRARLKSKRSCRLISTQCVEAGVDIDFPVVLRAFAPLDAIAQAAGRCNRNGSLPVRGRMVVFLPDEPERKAYPDGDYRQAANVTREVLQSLPVDRWDLESPQLYELWYRRLYDLTRLGMEERQSERNLHEAIRSGDFERTDQQYRLIPARGAQVVVPWDRGEFDELKRSSEESLRVKADWMRQAQIHSVNVFGRQLEKLVGFLLAAPLGAVLEEHRSDDWFFLVDEDLYEEDFGLGEPPPAIVV